MDAKPFAFFDISGESIHADRIDLGMQMLHNRRIPASDVDEGFRSFKLAFDLCVIKFFKKFREHAKIVSLFPARRSRGARNSFPASFLLLYEPITPMGHGIDVFLII